MRLIGLAVVLALSLILAPVIANEQQKVKMYRVGCLSLMPRAATDVARHWVLFKLEDWDASHGKGESAPQSEE